MPRMPKDIRQIIASRAIATVVVTALIGFVLAAADVDAQQAPPKGAPPEALEACADKSVGDACAITIRGQGDEVAGQCTATPDDQIACMPKDAPRPPRS